MNLNEFSLLYKIEKLKLFIKIKNYNYVLEYVFF